jgi:hypothetical protein
MSTAELIYEKAKLLSEPEAQSVLSYVVKLKPATLTARELRRLPSAERARLLAAQSAGAETLYCEHPQILNDCVDAPIDYGQADSR